jgi:hypothetical protein
MVLLDVPVATLRRGAVSAAFARAAPLSECVATTRPNDACRVALTAALAAESSAIYPPGDPWRLHLVVARSIMAQRVPASRGPARPRQGWQRAEVDGPGLDDSSPASGRLSAHSVPEKEVAEHRAKRTARGSEAEVGESSVLIIAEQATRSPYAIWQTRIAHPTRFLRFLGGSGLQVCRLMDSSRAAFIIWSFASSSRR